MGNKIFNLIGKDIKHSVIAAIFIGIFVYMFFGKKVFLSYDIGFIMGCLNFITLAYGTNLCMGLSPLKARSTHMLTFTVRYIMIGIIFSELIIHKDANIYALVSGLIIINMAIKLGPLIKCPSLKKGV